MLKRILSVIVWVICLPIVAVSAFSIIITGPLAVLIYLINGSDFDKLMGIFLGPFMWCVSLPYKIMGYDSW